MNWNALAAVAELIGAVAVVLSLLYLAAQIRQSTRTMRSAAFQSTIGFATAFAESLSRDPDLAAVFLAGISDYSSLNETDRLRFHFQMISMLRRYENMHYQSRMGLLHDEQWEGLRESLHHIIVNPGATAWWKENARLFNIDFGSFVDRRLEMTSPVSPLTQTHGTGSPTLFRSESGDAGGAVDRG